MNRPAGSTSFPPERRGEPFLVKSGKLSADERKIAVEAQKALTLLQEEGSSIAFPATVEQMHEDMEQVAERLADAKVDDITIGVEEDIIAALEEMIAALQQAQQRPGEEQQQQQQQQQQQARRRAAAGRSDRRAEDDQVAAGAGEQADAALLAAPGRRQRPGRPGRSPRAGRRRPQAQRAAAGNFPHHPRHRARKEPVSERAA